MSRNRFVKPETVRLKLSEEEWVEIKKELNAGEARKQASLAVVPHILEGRVVDRVDWSQYELLRMELWVVDWHLHNAEGKVPKLSLDALRALDVTTFNEINDLISQHVVESLTSKKVELNPSGTNDAPTL